ncbi:MAG TPA: hypothetical protein VLH56_16725 [Dissulfurispiraceae bacterium]|nr:hypothetical protein [Dissulfurispiraceae bacterium]
MATKKTAAPAKAVKAAAPKKTVPAKKCATKKCAPKSAVKTAPKATAKMKGSKYSCVSCGLIVTIDKVCGCVDMCEILCCGAPMKSSK